MKTAIVAVLTALVLAGCATERAARLYPANDAAMPLGVLEARFMAHGTGNGEVEITLSDGELLKGEYSIVRDGAIGFGTIFASVYGPRGSASGSAFSTSYAMEGRSPGIASAFGTKGTRMQCEFYNDNWSGHGYGACQSSRGSLYRLQY